MKGKRIRWQLMKTIDSKPMAAGWIPCSERLPEESLSSVIGWDALRERCVFVQYWQGHWQILGTTYGFDIKAWMPMPEAYEPDAKKESPAGNSYWFPADEMRLDREKCLLSTENGVTIGWYDATTDHWYVLQWYTCKDYITRKDLESGTMPVVSEAPKGYVKAWAFLPDEWIWKCKPDE